MPAAQISTETGASPPVDALEHCINADPGAVFRIFHACCDCAAAPQSWERGAVVFAGALNIQDRVAWDASLFVGQYGAELARRAELNVIGKQLLVRRIWATLDDDIIRLQIESGHDAVVDAAAEQGGEPDRSEGEYPVNHRPADTQV